VDSFITAGDQVQCIKGKTQKAETNLFKKVLCRLRYIALIFYLVNGEGTITICIYLCFCWGSFNLWKNQTFLPPF
jgi:hypothetical protein